MANNNELDILNNKLKIIEKNDNMLVNPINQIRFGSLFGKDLKQLSKEEQINLFNEMYKLKIKFSLSLSDICNKFNVPIKFFLHFAENKAVKERATNEYQIQEKLDDINERKKVLLNQIDRCQKELEYNSVYKKKINEYTGEVEKVFTGKYKNSKFIANFTYSVMNKAIETLGKLTELESKLLGLLDKTSIELNAQDAIINQVNNQLNLVGQELGLVKEKKEKKIKQNISKENYKEVIKNINDIGKI